MPRRTISRDVKLAAVRLYEQGSLDLHQILDCVGFSKRTFWRIWSLWRTTGDVVEHKFGLRGRPRKLELDDVYYLLRLVRHRPDYFLDELQDLLATNRFISVHYTTILRELARNGLSMKKLRKIARERNEIVRGDFCFRMGEYEPYQLGCLDETSKDDRTCHRRRGRAKKGHRAEKVDVFVRGKRVSALGFMTVDGMLASSVREGSFTRASFLEFIEHDVLPLTSPFPGPRSVLILDNAIIHHSQELAELADKWGVRLEFLPPYSPDYNPIEEAFSKIKAHIRREYLYFSTARPEAAIYDMLEAMDVITPEDAEGYFTHAGYF